MKCRYWDCGWCYAPIDVVTSASSSSSCIYPEHCPYLKTEMTKKQSKENTTYITTASGHPIDDDVVIINGVEYRKTVKPDIKPKVKTLYDICVDWKNADIDPLVSDLIDAIEQWLPKEQSANSQNAYVESAVEGFNDCLQQIKSKLR